MENNMQIFENELFGSIRTLVEGEKVLFCGSDVAKALGYARPKDAVAAHTKGAVKRRTLTNGGLQEMSFITEGDIYRLIVKSKLPEAEKFERWVFDDVLPTIRKTGGYIAGADQMTDAELMAQALLVAQRTIEEKQRRLEAAELKIQLDASKVEFATHVEASENSLSVGDFAKLLCDNENISIGRNRLCKLFRDKEVFGKNNVARQEYIDRGYFEVVEAARFGKVYPASRVTGKGQLWATKKIKEWLA